MRSAHRRFDIPCRHVFLLAAAFFLVKALPAGATDIWTNGNGDNTWHIGAPAGDWSNGGPVAYTDGDDVLFDDTAPAGSYTISIAAGGVNPNSVTVNNSLNDYTLGGPGFIGSGTLTKTGDGTLTIANSTANTYVGFTSVQSGLLQLDLSNLATPTNLVSSNSALVMNGGGLAVTSAASGASSQTLNGAMFSSGDSAVSVSNTAAGLGNTTTLALGGLSRNNGATADFTIPASGGSITTTTGNSSNNIIGGWATVNNDDWATASGAGPTYTIAALAAGSYTADAWASGNNTDVTMDSAPGHDSTTNSLRFNDSGDYTVALASLNGSTANKIISGGILMGSGASKSNNLITGGNLTSGASELIVNQRSSGSLTISSTIVDNGGNHIGLTKSGPGSLTLTGSNTYTDPTWVSAGNLYVENTSGSGTGFGTSVNVSQGAYLGGGHYSGGSSQGILGTPGHLTNVNINSGATLAPGQGFGAANNLVINGNLTLSDNSNLSYVLSNTSTAAGPANGNDLLTVTGTVNLGNTVSLTPGEDFAYNPGTYTLINGYTSANNTGNLSSWILNGYDSAVATGSAAPTFAQNGSTIQLTIPTPASPSNNPPPQFTPGDPNVDFPGFMHGAPPQEPPASPMDPKPSQHFVGANEDVTNHSGLAQSSVNIVLNGDWTGGQLQGNYPTFGVGNTNFSTSYNGTTMQTTLTISSKNGSTVPNGKVAHVGYSLLNGTGATGEGGSAETAFKYWGAATGSGLAPANPNFRLPAPTFFLDNLSPGLPAYGANTQFLILYSTIELANGGVAGEWSELQVPNGANIKIGIGNNDDAGDGPMFTFDAKFMFSPTQIPLDDLNSIYEPPTGSSFQPLPGFTDGTMIGAGSSLESDPILVPMPEPGSAVLLAVGGGLALMWRRRWRRS